MKQKISKVAAAMLLTASLPVTAEMCSNFNPYVGADAQYRYMPFENDFGGNIFKKTSPQANFFVGNRFNEYFGLELGYNTSKKVKRDVRLTSGQVVAGSARPLPPTVFLDLHSTSKVSAFSTTAHGFLPIPDICGLDLIGSIGFARTKINLTYDRLADDVGPIPTNNRRRTFVAHKVITRLGAGIQYAILDNLSVRAFFNWENTKRFQNLRAKEAPAAQLRLKNSVIYSLGLKYSF
ncbi:MAG TPA: outer membrane beta-barrel protein [Gammaproteobacteria bacterium]|nr:outer membrane beta-barrel protein [Gammaproteobacteria bacterium]